MNVKVAKRLRKQAMYKPSKQPTTYEKNPETGALEVAADCPRYLYRELKKEYKNERSL